MRKLLSGNFKNSIDAVQNIGWKVEGEVFITSQKTCCPLIAFAHREGLIDLGQVDKIDNIDLFTIFRRMKRELKLNHTITFLRVYFDKYWRGEEWPLENRTQALAKDIYDYIKEEQNNE